MHKIATALALVGTTVLSVLTIAVPSPATAATAVWSYSDPKYDAGKYQDVTSTQLDVNVPGNYRIRIHGREFVDGRINTVRIYLDTSKANPGPEYRYDWFMLNSPLLPRTQWLDRVDDFGTDSIRTVPCPGLFHAIDYNLDVVTLKIPRGCVGGPAAVRWSGFVGRMTSYTNSYLTGYWDDFPRRNAFDPRWVA